MAEIRPFAVSLALLLAALLLGPAAGALEGPWSEEPEVRVRLVSPWAVAPGPTADGAPRPVTFGLEAELEPGWHIYWKNSGDAGYPPAVTLGPADRVSEGRLRFPAPERYLLPGDLVALGYEDRVIYPIEAELLAGDGEGGGVLELVAEVDYVVCEVECIPYSTTLTLEQPVAPAGEAGQEDPAGAERLAAWEERLPVPLEAAGGAAELFIELPVELPTELPEAPATPSPGAGEAALGPTLILELRDLGDRAETDRAELFLEVLDLFDTDPPEAQEIDGGLRFRVPLEWRQRLDEPPASVPVSWVVTGLEATGETSVEGSGEAPLRQASAAAGEGSGAAGPPSVLRAFLEGLASLLVPGVLALAAFGFLALGRHRSPFGAALAAAGGAFGALVLLGLAAALWPTLRTAPAFSAALLLLAALVTFWLWGLTGRAATTLASAPTGGLTTARAALGGWAAGLLASPLALFSPQWLQPVARAVGFEGFGGSLAAGAPGAAQALLVAAYGAGLLGPWLLLVRLRPAHPVGGGAADAASDPATSRSRRIAEALGFVAAGSVIGRTAQLAGLVAAETLAFTQLALLVLALALWMARRAGDAALGAGAAASGRPRPARLLWLALALAAAAAALWLHRP